MPITKQAFSFLHPTLGAEVCNVQYVCTNIMCKIPIQTRTLCTLCLIRV